MPQDASALSQLPAACYRVSAKALIFDARGRLLVAADKDGEWEIPGGGLEHGETFDECVVRELAEELQANVVRVGAIAFVYGGMSRGVYHKLNLAARVEVEQAVFTPTGDDLAEARFVTREEFLRLPFQSSEAEVLKCADKIWPLALNTA